VTTQRALAASGAGPASGQPRPEHFAHQFLDTAAFAIEFADRIYHVHVKDSRRLLDGRSSILGGHLNFGEPQRGWTSSHPVTATSTSSRSSELSTASGTRAALDRVEDSGMDREWGAQDALAFVRRHGLRAVRRRVRRRDAARERLIDHRAGVRGTCEVVHVLARNQAFRAPASRRHRPTR